MQQQRRALVMLMVLVLHVISTTTTQVCCCLLEEKRALLDFKASINETRYAHLLLPSWTNINGSENGVDEEASSSDCCNWEGVKCSNTTGRIVELQLRNLRHNIYKEAFYENRDWYLNMSTFLSLTHLQALDLGYNNFQSGVEDCGQLASLENLESLNLDYNYFNISIIPCITAIPALKTLSLAGNYFLTGLFSVEDCGQLASLENLESLNLDYNGFNISIIPCVTSIPALKTLSLAGNNLEGVFPVEDCGQLASLENLESLNLDYNGFNISIIPCVTSIPALKTLSLAGNNLEGVFPVEDCGQLASLENLESLNLDDNYFNISIIPCITAIPALKTLSLAENNLEGVFPVEEFNHLTQLKNLNLSYTGLQGPLSFKELKLEKLEVLNLEGTQMKELLSIEVMTSLKALSLSGIGINDSSILEGVCNLKNLNELDLSYNYFGGHVPSCLNNLTSIRVLDISKNNFSGDIPAVIISRLINLEYLSLSGNYFGGSFSFSSFANHSKLQVFKLVHESNDLYVDTEGLALPPPFQLRILYLSGCNLNKRIGSRIPSFLFNQKELEVLDLSSNKLAGEFPTWLIENNTQLEYLSLKNNSFTGSFLLNGSSNLNLSWLDISNNKVSGKVPVNIGLLFPNLWGLNFSGNSFEGNIPQSLGNLTTARSIDFSHNKFFGEVSDRITTGCVNLEFLSLSDNNLQGHFPFINLTGIIVLYLDNNNFSGSISRELSLGGSTLFALDISNNELRGKISSWIGNFTLVSDLDMSKNLLEGTIPDDICKLQELSFLDLSQNRLSGPLPSCSNLTSLRFIHLHKNHIIGSLSSMFFRSSNLMSLDLRDNQLSGSIPQYIGEHKKLRILLLGGNNLLGRIPLHVCNLKNLTIMDLSRNKFFGPLPSCLNNISFGREYFDKDAFDNSDFNFRRSGTSKIYLNNYFLDLDWYREEYVRFFTGQEEVEFTTKSRTEFYTGIILNLMSGLDLSCNQLTGEIPSEFGGLSGIRALNLSHNFLQGSIPSSLSMLNQIESMDLSYNNFSGEIPSELAGLHFLSIFNVSYNNLSGRIPDKGQFANFDERNYKGNPGLCGPFLKRSCDPINNNVPQPEKNVGDHGEESDGAIDKVAFTWSFFGSYMVTLLALAAIVCISPYYQKAWSNFIDVWILSSYYKYCRSRYW